MIHPEKNQDKAFFYYNMFQKSEKLYNQYFDLWSENILEKDADDLNDKADLYYFEARRYLKLYAEHTGVFIKF